MNVFRVPVISRISGETKRYVTLTGLPNTMVGLNVTTREWDGGIRMRQVVFTSPITGDVIARELVSDEEYMPIDGLNWSEE